MYLCSAMGGQPLIFHDLNEKCPVRTDPWGWAR
jgi:hypothetical protein